MRTSRSFPEHLQLLWGLVLFGVLGLSGPSVARDRFDETTDRGIALYQEQRYEEAIQAFSAAYALRQLPRLLINIGQAHLKLGQAREALRYYEHYLKLRPDPEPAVRLELERSMEEARALLAGENPEPPPAQATSKPETKGDSVALSAPSLNQNLVPAPAKPPIYKRWWFWTGLSALSVGAVVGGVLAARPWQDPLWDAVPKDHRRGVTF